LEAFFDQLQPKFVAQFDGLIGSVSLVTQHQSLRGLPPTKFPRGVSNLSKMTADKVSGILFTLVLVLSCNVTYSNQLPCKVNKVVGLKSQLQDFLHLFEMLLSMEQWMSLDDYPKVQFKPTIEHGGKYYSPSEYAMRKCMEQFKKTIN